jgi:hypothetical protein
VPMEPPPGSKPKNPLGRGDEKSWLCGCFEHPSRSTSNRNGLENPTAKAKQIGCSSSLVRPEGGGVTTLSQKAASVVGRMYPGPLPLLLSWPGCNVTLHRQIAAL